MARKAHVGRATGDVQISASGTLYTVTGTPVRGHWPILLALEDGELVARIPQGAGGSLAVYMDAGKPFHIISKVFMRMHAWTGYLTSP